MLREPPAFQARVSEGAVAPVAGATAIGPSAAAGAADGAAAGATESMAGLAQEARAARAIARTRKPVILRSRFKWHPYGESLVALYDDSKTAPPRQARTRYLNKSATACVDGNHGIGIELIPETINFH